MILPRRGLGILLPSSNTVMEPETMALLPPDGSVTAHFTRFRMVTVSDAESSTQQFSLELMLAAASVLADVQPEAILWGGTAASWLGFDHDDRLCAAVQARTGIPCFGTVQLINRVLAQSGVRRIGLVTPYIAPLEAAIIANYAAIGIETVAAERRDITDNIQMAACTTDEIAAMAGEVARSQPQAIIIMCTNLRGSSIAPALSKQLGLPVLDSVRVPITELLTTTCPLGSGQRSW